MSRRRGNRAASAGPRSGDRQRRRGQGQQGQRPRRGQGGQQQPRQQPRKQPRQQNRNQGPLAAPPLPTGPLGSRVRRDVDLVNDPALEEIARAQNEGRDIYQETDVAYQDIHNRLTNDLGRVPTSTQQMPAIQQQMMRDMNSGGDFGAFTAGQGDFGYGPTNAAETSAANAAMNSIGGGAQAALAGISARDQAYQNSVGMQAGVDLATRRANNLEAYNDLIAQLQNRKLDVNEDMGAQRQARMDELRDQRFQQQLARAQFGLERKAQRTSNKSTEALIDYIKGSGGGGHGGHGGGGGGQGGGGGGAGQRTPGERAQRDSSSGGPAPGPRANTGSRDNLGWARDMSPAERRSHQETLTRQIQDLLPIEGKLKKSSTGYWYVVRPDGSHVKLEDLSMTPKALKDIQFLLKRRRQLNNVGSRRRQGGNSSDTRPYGE